MTKTREELTAEAEAKAFKDLDEKNVSDRFVAKAGDMQLIEEADPSKTYLWDDYGNAVDADGNLLPDPPVDDPPPS